MIYKIGIDVGGTNTDAVILDEGNNLIAGAKSPTTTDVSTGIYKSLVEVIQMARIDPLTVRYVMLGTTHCTNAIIERKSLAKVAAIRIGLPAGKAIEPMFTWPPDLREAVGDRWHYATGGYEFDGRLIERDLDRQEVRGILSDIKRSGCQALAISCIFSPVRSDHERQVADLAREILGSDIPVTLSYEIGNIGLLERENSAVLNAALVNVIKLAAEGLEKALREKGISNARVFFTQNDGTLMSINYAKKYPVLTIGSGPTNSIRGATYLTGLNNGIVVDVGGTSTDVGIVIKGFPRESAVAVVIGGVKTNFRMPDILSIGLGGGSVVRTQADGTVAVGPDSVGYLLTEKGLAWGGNVLTTTDILLSAGEVQLPGTNYDLKHLAGIAAETRHKVDQAIKRMIENTIDKIKTNNSPLPVVLVGGGSILVTGELEGASRLIRPENYQHANAIGAAIAQVSGEVDRMWSLEKVSRRDALAQAKEMAVAEAVKAGASRDTVEIVEVEDVPIAYLPSNALRIKVKAAGDLAG